MKGPIIEPDHAALIACVEREIKLRKRVYPGWVARKRMTQEKADAEIALMSKVLEHLQKHAPEGAPTAPQQASLFGGSMKWSI